MTRLTPCGCLLVMLVVVIVVGVLSWMGWSARNARLVEEEMSKIRAAGEPTSASELDQFFRPPPNNQDATQIWLDGMADLDHPSSEDDVESPSESAP